MRKLISIVLLIFIYTTQYAQNVGIGISNPTHPLTVAANSNKGILQKDGTLEVGFFTNTNTSAYMQTFTNHPLYFTTNNGPARLAVATNGNVGVGTTSPVTTFHVAGSSSLMGLTGISTTSPTAGLDINSSLRIRSTNPVIGAELTSADANGNAEWARPYAFKARGGFDGQPNIIENSTWTKVFFNQTLPYNIGLSFEPINSQMVAPVKGVYHFDAQVHWDEKFFESGIRLVLNRNGSISTIAENFHSLSTVQTGEILIFKKPNQVSTEILLEAGDIVYVEAFVFLHSSSGSNTTINAANALTYFNGHRAVRN